MNVVVCGSTVWKDEDKIRERLADLPSNTHIIHGAAIGADQMAGAAAQELGFSVDEYPPELTEYTKEAFAKACRARNIAMVETNPDLVIAFWDGKSHGTFHTMYEAVVRNIPVEVVH